MKLGAALLNTIHKAERLLERFDVAPQEVGPVVQERRFRDTFSDGKSSVDNWLASKDFKAKYQATVEGTSYRADEVKQTQKKYQAYLHKDSFEAFKKAPVTFKAADLQRVFIAG